MKRTLIIAALFIAAQSMFAQSSGYQKLDEWLEIWKDSHKTLLGYPINEQSELHDFYKWYVESGMDQINLNNAGDPMTDNPWNISTQDASWSTDSLKGCNRFLHSLLWL